MRARTHTVSLSCFLARSRALFFFLSHACTHTLHIHTDTTLSVHFCLRQMWRARTHTHTHSLSLLLFRSRSVSLSSPPSLSLFSSLSHTHTHKHTHARTHIPRGAFLPPEHAGVQHIHIHTHNHAHIHVPPPHKQRHTDTYIPALCYTHTHIRTHKHTASPFLVLASVSHTVIALSATHVLQ